MTIIAPSLLSCDFLNIESELKAFEGIPDFWFHLDIMDGHFVPNMTMGHPIIEKICNASTIPMDAHYMVSNPEFHLDTMKEYGLHNFTFHYEAVDHPLELIQRGKQFYPSMGISIKPKTDPSVLSDELLKEVDLVLVMSVEPGFGGQAFIEESYDKIQTLSKRRHELGLSFQIQVDGGVSNANAEKLIRCGVDNLVAGSYIFKQSNYRKAVESLRS